MSDRSLERVHDVQKKGMTNPDVIKFYNKWAEDYDEDLESTHWAGPGIVAQEVSELIADRNIKILDCAAGTGLVGQELYRRGFRNIDALDPAEDMLNIAKKKDVYTKYFMEYLGTNKLPIGEDSYDVITIVGAFTEGHVKPNCLEELVRITKPGGYVVLSVRDDKLKEVDELKNNLEKTLNSFLETGRAVTLIKKRSEKYGSGAVPGWLFFLQMAVTSRET